MKLGKQPATYDSRDIRYADVRPRSAALPEAPPPGGGYGDDYASGSQLKGGWGMFGNGPCDDGSIPESDAAYQGAGDCAWAGPAHEEMEAAKNSGRPVPAFTSLNVLEQYSAYSGYNLQTGANDTGSNVRDVLKWRQQKGLLDASGTAHRIGTFVALEPGNTQQLWEALWLFENVGIGINFPNSAMDQFNQGQMWSVVPGATLQGGHYIPLVGHGQSDVWTCITWGKAQPMTSQFLTTYCVAARHRVLTDDLRWVPGSELRVGDGLLAFDERTRTGGRRYRRAEVLATQIVEADVLDVELSTGQVISTTPDHRWLTKNGAETSRWVRSDRLRTRRLRSRVASYSTPHRVPGTASKVWTSIPRLMPVWEPRTSYEDGWLAGILDGEGHMKTRGAVLSFAQNRGPVLERALDSFARLGMLGSLAVHNKRRPETAVATAECVTVHLQGKLADRLHLIGALRPTRMLARLDCDELGRLHPYERDDVVDVRRGGRQLIAKITTSTGTMIVEGYPMHNCDEAWAYVDPERYNAVTGETLQDFTAADLQKYISLVAKEKTASKS